MSEWIALSTFSARCVFICINYERWPQLDIFQIDFMKYRTHILAADVIDAFYFAVVPHPSRHNNAIILLVSMACDDLLADYFFFSRLFRPRTHSNRGLDNPKPSQAKPRTFQIWHDMAWCDWKLACISTDSSNKAELRASIMWFLHMLKIVTRVRNILAITNAKQPSECLLGCLHQNFIWKYCC